MRRRLLLTLVTLLVASSATGQEQPEQPGHDPDHIVVAGGDAFIPLIFRNAQDEPDGIHAEIWRRWSEKTGVATVLRLAPWTEAIPALLRGDVDAVDGVTLTPERTAFLDFSAVYGHMETYLFFHTDIGGVLGLDDIAGFPIGVIQDSNIVEYLAREAPSLVPVPHVNHEALVTAALNDRIRVFVGEEPMVSYFLARLGERGGQFRRTEAPIVVSDLRAAVRKGESQLLALIDAGLAEFTAAEHARVREAWTGVAAVRPPGRVPWRWIGLALGLAAVGAIGLVVWNTALRRRVERATRSLSESERRYRQLVDDAPVPILVHSDERVVLANRRAVAVLGGSSSTEFVDMSIWDAIHPDDAEVVRQRVGRVYQHQESAPLVEVRMRRRDGGVIDVEAVATHVTFEGRPASQVVFADITERKALETQLRQSQKMDAIGQLAGGVAHDFNNLLQVITGHTVIAQSDLEEGHPVLHNLAEIHTAAERAAALTRQLLTFGRREIVRPEVLDVNVIVRELLAMLRRGIPANVAIERQLAPDLRPVRADRVQIEQVVMNLALNARDAMRGGGTLTVTTANTDPTSLSPTAPREIYAHGGIVISVRDTGPGVADNIHDQIFEPFFTTKEVGRGTGLGLTTVLAIARRWGGGVELDSAPGRGAEFRVLLQAADARATPPPDATDREPTPGEGETILLAEDDDLVRSLAVRVLEEAGYRLLVACDGAAAIALVEARAAEVDLALLDVVMPQRSGREVHDALKARVPQVPVLFCSGYSRDAMAREQLPPDGVNLIQKPYPPRELLRQVRAILQEQSSRSPK